ncbi:hypothetical protein KP509_27G022500 [Ceratopteris richardii]|uniref:Uncharacterized protein n=1 Tax=Ceratopteris richardii TaxID=49495 RepID=A0A8T2RH28_CERRI|nr:hypothetical protein KP509_27G022500 [Ceratopteris richardii]
MSGIHFVQSVEKFKRQDEKVEFDHSESQEVAKIEDENLNPEEIRGLNKKVISLQKTDETKAPMESKEHAPLRDSPPVLADRNSENNIYISSGAANRMISPVLMKLRRNQERRVTTANPVNPVQVPPKEFRDFPVDRYMSPTDSIMSPISRGLLARNRRSRNLPPAFVPPKVLDSTFEEAEADNHAVTETIAA